MWQVNRQPGGNWAQRKANKEEEKGDGMKKKRKVPRSQIWAREKSNPFDYPDWLASFKKYD